ncbi:MAG: tetratricopeptide repeat protein [Acidobacteriota bacterium]
MQPKPIARSTCLAALLMACLLAPGIEATQQTLADKAATAFTAQEWQAAAEAYGELTRAEPENGAAWFRLGRSRQALGKADDALKAYEKALAAGFNAQLTRFEIARSHAAKGEAETALGLLREVANAGPSRLILSRFEASPELAGLDAKAILEISAALTPCNTPEYRQFDFWLGDWAVESPTNGTALGRNHVTSHLGGCALLESWTSAGPQQGMSLNYYDSRDRSWNQIYIDDSGNVGNWPPLKGGLVDGEMVLESPADATPRTRWTWSDLGHGKVRQRAESSTDGGKTWNTGWDSIYVLQEAQPDGATGE